MRSTFVHGEIHVCGDIEDGGHRRVSATDNLALLQDMRATAAVTAYGAAIDDSEETKKLMDSDVQYAEAGEAKKIFKDYYTVVYMPEAPRHRVHAALAPRRAARYRDRSADPH